MTTPPKPPADAFYAALTPDKTHSIASKADALPEVKALEPARITDARILVAALNDSSDLCLLAAGVIADWEKDQRIAQLETSLRSSEAALATLYHDWKEKCIEADTMRQHFKVAEELLAEARQLASVLSADLQDAQERLNVEEADHFYEEDKLTAELTALRANAPEDSRLLDWLGMSGRTIITAIPGGFDVDIGFSMPHEHKEITLRQAIRAAVTAATPPASLASGGEKTL